MSKIEKVESVYSQMENDNTTQKFIAQANARYILFGVNEDRKKFPFFSQNLNEGLDFIAYTYLSIGCCFAEVEMIYKANEALSKAATIIEYNHFPNNNRNNISFYHILVGGLAYYASCQYSKAFVLLKDNHDKEVIASLIGFFLRKNYKELKDQINDILLDDRYRSEEYLRIYDILMARVFASLLLYIEYGDIQQLDDCLDILNDAIELSAIDSDPSLWWSFRLFRIIAKGFRKSSLWFNLSVLSETKNTNKYLEYENNLKGLPCSSPISPNKEYIINAFISNFVFRSKNPVIELFISQRQSLEKVLSPDGSVVSLPTSSGKTRIAEIAILQSLLDNPTSHILYLAPFRSLAFEVEETLSKTFSILGYNVSHLYGGAQFSQIDLMVINNSNIIIATPEKAKAILRANDELSSNISLIIIDEGHLLGSECRFVRNEMFTEELRFLMKKNGGKIILLSAVLPNSAEISQWIANDKKQIVSSSWRASSQRFGFLEFTGSGVNLEWRGEEKSYNLSFIEFVNNKKSAIAQAAYKLSKIGSVLIYVCRANMVMGQAKEVYNQLVIEKVVDIDWGDDCDWVRFELSCVENDLDGNILKYARKGIMCHSNKLPSEIRLCMERLLRKGKSRFIVSTSTLAQGVNLGVSTVIIANVFINRNPIPHRDFWNIVGRAGRAFVDTEGKILYVIDGTKSTVNWQKKVANNYFDQCQLESAQSGILTHIIEIKEISERCGVEFDYLLELITENNFEKFELENKNYIIDFFDCIDDSLLNLNIAYESYDIDDSSWIEGHFKDSLAYIQAAHEAPSVMKILSARSVAVKKLAGSRECWKFFASSGIPLMSITKIDELMDEITIIAYAYLRSDMNIKCKLIFLKEMEEIIKKLPSAHFRHDFSQKDIDCVRDVWLSGNSLKNISGADKISNNYFGFTIPWIFNAISKKYIQEEKEDHKKLFEEFAVLCELGLPSFWAARIYLSGIRSRRAAKELSLIFNEELVVSKLSEISNIIIEYKDVLKGRVDCSEYTLSWVELLAKDISPININIPCIYGFKVNLDDLCIKASKLYCKSFSGVFYLCDSCYKEKVIVRSDADSPFDKIANIPGIYFEKVDGDWIMRNNNPHYILSE